MLKASGLCAHRLIKDSQVNQLSCLVSNLGCRLIELGQGYMYSVLKNSNLWYVNKLGSRVVAVPKPTVNFCLDYHLHAASVHLFEGYTVSINHNFLS